MWSHLARTRDNATSGERHCRPEPVFVQISGHVDMQISALNASTRWMDERGVTSKKCWIGIEKQMLDISENE